MREIINDKGRTAPTLCASLAVHDINIPDLWSLETIGILDANQNLSNAAEEEIARDQFLSSLTRKENGCYCVGLPWLGRSVELPSNYQVAEKRLFGITRRLGSLRKYEEYDGVFKEWLEEGVIEMVPDHELNSKGHYLPHHPVFKPDSVTTKIRPVFDASSKGYVAQKLSKSFYVDNCVTSVDNERELVDFVKCSTKILADAKMDLRLWTYGPVGEAVRSALDGLNAESTSDNIVPVLGIMWDRKGDTLYLECKTVLFQKTCLREVLSLTQGMFDPLGFLTPVLLTAKLLLQEMWACGVGWDTPLTENVKRKFLKWYNGLEVLNELRILRRMGFGDRNFWSLHVFCDASQHAYATVIFL
ncbi:uncharacterized protein TNIN_134281 [Trichonephila inaurata madagascariensis]|uniref:Uncharacterized protein n=1 Tax=Trichonephila inaurata madagascariensis TaxID=2747483 RepID=A0A8X6WVD5_9ARAC|nr:uncharacterized protein TNIN_134281 [Trichonephila inaurata madagascariensis]